ncbi:MAG TPA: UbiD family decarboxylase [Terriglobales bacterium]|nr:UbiD family decarboxylase [Terriglobales bacterium]
MAFADLREFVAALERAGELKRISADVSPILEIPEVTDRVSKRGGPALLFENPTGYRARPLLINQFGSRRRMALALGVDHVDEIAARIRALLEMKPPQGMIDKLKLLPMLAEFGAFFPRTVKSGACQEVIVRENFSVLDFPVLQCWPEDGGRYITFPLVFTRHPTTGRRNVGMYRLQVFDGQTLGMHWQIHKQGADHMRERTLRDAPAAAEEFLTRAHGVPAVQAAIPAAASDAATRMPVAVAIGTDPATTFSAILPAPPALDEMMLAGFLRQKPVEMVKCQTVDLEVPACAEIVLEGYVDLTERRTEGPFGDHTGFYSLADQYPVLHLTCITHRRDPIYSTTIVGKPPMEDGWMGEAVGRIFLPLMQMQFPEIVDVNMPVEGVFHNLMIVTIRKAYPGHARKIMNGIWGLGQAMFTKCIVVLDHDVDPHNIPDVVLKAFNNIDPERDIQFTLGPIDALDHASRLPNFGSKMGVDATKKWPSEGFVRPWPRELIMDQSTKAKVDALWARLGLS